MAETDFIKLDAHRTGASTQKAPTTLPEGDQFETPPVIGKSGQPAPAESLGGNQQASDDQFMSPNFIGSPGQLAPGTDGPSPGSVFASGDTATMSKSKPTSTTQPVAPTTSSFIDGLPSDTVKSPVSSPVSLDQFKVTSADAKSTSTVGQDTGKSTLPTGGTGAQAVKWDVTPDQLVENRFKSVMESDNPAFDVVKQQIIRASAAAGGQNSLMAQRSAAQAVAEVGFKIASQDAQTLARSAEFNAAMQNQFGLADQAFMHNALLSRQNFDQGVMMLLENHKANLEMAAFDTNNKLGLLGASQLIDLNMEGFRHNNTLSQIDRQFGANAELQRQQFGQNSELQRQAFDESTQLQDQQTANQAQILGIQHGFDSSIEQQRGGIAASLAYLQEIGENGRSLVNAIAQIGSSGAKAQQVSAAIADVLRNYNAINDQVASVAVIPPIPGGGVATSYMDFSTPPFVPPSQGATGG